MLTNEEKLLLTEACSIYLQVISQQPQIKPEQVEGIKKAIDGIFIKIQQGESGNGTENVINKPIGITDEWFEEVCKTCDKLNGTQCKDSVTKNFPGKCDPILKYEQKKIMKISEDTKPKLKIYKPEE